MTADVSGRLLDCACGTGEITAAILGSGRFIGATVLDLSPRMLELARQHILTDPKASRIDRLEFKASDIFEFTTQPHGERYDLILCLGLIAHTGRLDKLLAGFRTLLNPKGSVLLQSSLLDHAGTKIVRAFTNGRYRRRYGYPLSYFHHRDISKAARDAGFAPRVIRRFAFGLPFGDRLWARMNYLLERRMQNWAKSHGAEAMYLLQAV